MLPEFKNKFPLSVAAGLTPVMAPGGNEHEGFDVDQVKTKLGATRFALLMGTVKNDFVCAHRVDKSGHEVHCLWAKDVEAFLKGGG